MFKICGCSSCVFWSYSERSGLKIPSYGRAVLSLQNQRENPACLWFTFRYQKTPKPMVTNTGLWVPPPLHMFYLCLLYPHLISQTRCVDLSGVVPPRSWWANQVCLVGKGGKHAVLGVLKDQGWEPLSLTGKTRTLVHTEILSLYLVSKKAVSFKSLFQQLSSSSCRQTIDFNEK